MNTHVQPPGEAREAPLYVRTPVTPEEAFQAIGRLRKEARDAIDELIRFLDKTDDYVSRELEDQVDDRPVDEDELEASLCGVTVAAPNMPAGGDGPDLEGDGDGGYAEDEPSLGSLNVSELGTQAFWALSGTTDREDEHDGSEPSLCGSAEMAGAQANDKDLEGDQADNEPSLGFPEQHSQIGGHPGNYDDRELAGEPGKKVVAAASDRPSTHCKTDHSGMHVDIDDSVRIGTRKIRNLSPKQEKLLAPRIDRSEVRL